MPLLGIQPLNKRQANHSERGIFHSKARKWARKSLNYILWFHFSVLSSNISSRFLRDIIFQYWSIQRMGKVSTRAPKIHKFKRSNHYIYQPNKSIPLKSYYIIIIIIFYWNHSFKNVGQKPIGLLARVQWIPMEALDWIHFIQTIVSVVVAFSPEIRFHILLWNMNCLVIGVSFSTGFMR